MPELPSLAQWTTWSAGIGLLILFGLQIGAFLKFRHASFLVLSIGTLLGLLAPVVSVLYPRMPFGLSSQRAMFAVPMICGIAQIPIAICGVAWLFRSYGELHERAAIVAAGNSRGAPSG